jgi:hypothetical protein
VGPNNDFYLRDVARSHRNVICAWGANAKPERVASVVELLQEAGATLWCLGTTKGGAPRHPLYVRGDHEFVKFNPTQTSKGQTT